MRGEGKADTPILVGSVKPNVGHSEASSSISTVMKAVLAIENKIIPPTAGIVNLNQNSKTLPSIRFIKSKLIQT
jgi:acyl transferase domain-containing protein